MKTGGKTKIGAMCASIIDDVEAGRLKVGDKVPSLVKLMNRFDCAQVTAATVVKQLKADGVVYTLNGSGTYICPPPRRFKIVVLHSPDLGPAFSQQNIAMHQFLHGATHACKTRFRQYAMIEDTYEAFFEQLDLAEIVYPGLRGVVLFRHFADIERIVAALDARGIPWIFCGSDRAQVTFRNRLLVKDSTLAGKAVSYLHGKGHSRIGLVYVAGHPVHEDILRNFRIAMARWGLELSPEHVVAVRDTYGHDAPERLRPLLALPAAQRPSALFCAADSVAINVLTGLLMAGVRCPEELSVLGSENTPFVENTRPALSTLAVPMEKDGAMCVEQVIRAWGKPSKPIQMTSEIGLVERESVSVPSGNVVTGASASA